MVLRRALLVLCLAALCACAGSGRLPVPLPAPPPVVDDGIVPLTVEQERELAR